MKMKTIIAVLVVVVTFKLTQLATTNKYDAFAFDSPIKQVSKTVSKQVVVETYNKADPIQALLYWAHSYKTDYNVLLTVCKAESGCRNGETNPKPVCSVKYGCEHATGLMQFLPSTFYANAPRAGLLHPNIWSIDDQARTAAFMFSIGQQKQWETYDTIYGNRKK